MAKYVFFSFWMPGHVNPTLALVKELVSRGEQVVYYLPESFRQTIEATGATFRAKEFALFDQQKAPAFLPAGIQRFARADHTPSNTHNRAMIMDKLLTTLPHTILRQCPQEVPALRESVLAEQPDCIVTDHQFLWARIVARMLHIPVVALCPYYLSNEHFSLYGQPEHESPFVALHRPALDKELAEMGAAYDLSPAQIRALAVEPEPLTIAFLPRSLQPAGETFDEHYLFVGSSLEADRSVSSSFPFERLDTRPLLYISLGTVFHNQLDFYTQCFAAFSESEWQVVLTCGTEIDSSMLPAIPDNFLVVANAPQLEILQRAQVFISHGGMNSTIESLFYGVPLVIIPQFREHEVTAQRVEDFGLGLALDKTRTNAQELREVVTRVAHDPAFRKSTQSMQQEIREAGGYQRAADAIMHFTQEGV